MRPSLDEYYLSMLPLVASRGTCPRRQVAAILVDARGRVLSTGHNGNPSGMPHCDERPCAGHPDRPGALRADCEAVHAETNAVLLADQVRRAGSTLYCTTTPCFDCAKLLVTAGVRHVVCATAYRHDDRGPDLLGRGGVGVWVWNQETRGRDKWARR